ncbi:MAG: hypothetical protein IJ191_02365, partial [Treponema sp.]|nr:hypothetical protein [Treponema sp.]
MKRTVTVIGAAVAAVLGFVVFSCRSAPKTSSETVAASGWVECTKESVQDCGFFYTTAELGQFSVIEGEFRKDAGYESSGFGFAFGYSAEKGGVLADYIRFEINTVGQYALYAWDGRAFTDLLDATAQNTAYLVDSSAVR